MIDVSAPALEAGLALAACAVIIGFAMRLTSGPILAKMSTCASLSAAAIAVPWLINSMQGLAKVTTFEALPHCIDVVAVVPDDASKSATVLLKDTLENGGGLRSYQILVDDNIRDGLAQAMEALRRGDPAVLCKDEQKPADDKRKGYGGQKTFGKMNIDPSLFLKNLKGSGGD